MTHDAAFGAYEQPYGAEWISEVLRTCRPPLHVFGHVHPENGRHEFTIPGCPTPGWIFEDLGFGRKCDGTLERTMGILEWQDGEGPVNLVDDEWLLKMRHHNWNEIWP